MIRRIANLIWELKGLNAFFAHTMWISRLDTESFGKLYDFRLTFWYESFFSFLLRARHYPGGYMDWISQVDNSEKSNGWTWKNNFCLFDLFSTGFWLTLVCISVSE